MEEVDEKLSQVKCGRGCEYIDPLQELTSMSQVRQEIAGLLRDYRFANLRNVYEGEILPAKQNFQVSNIFIAS